MTNETTTEGFDQLIPLFTELYANCTALLPSAAKLDLYLTAHHMSPKVDFGVHIGDDHARAGSAEGIFEILRKYDPETSKANRIAKLKAELAELGAE